MGNASELCVVISCHSCQPKNSVYLHTTSEGFTLYFPFSTFASISTLKPSMIMSVIGLHTCDERLEGHGSSGL